MDFWASRKKEIHLGRPARPAGWPAGQMDFHFTKNPSHLFLEPGLEPCSESKDSESDFAQNPVSGSEYRPPIGRCDEPDLVQNPVLDSESRPPFRVQNL